MGRVVVTALEHQTLAVGDAGDSGISVAEASKLAALADARPGFCTFGHRSVKLSQYAGLVNLGDRILEVLPKIGESTDPRMSRATFLRMLLLARGITPFSGGSTDHALTRGSLLGVFIASFLREVSTVVKGGLLRRYRDSRDDLRMVRGRIALGRQAAVLGMRPDVVACAFDELCVDHRLNQVLRAGLQAVRPWIESVEDGRRWMELVSAFDGVKVRRDALELSDGLLPDRQSSRYSAAMRWAILILRLLTPSLRAGSTQAPELLFDMNRLFESAVAAVLRAKVPLELKLVEQSSDRYLAHLEGANSRAYRLRPDLVLHGPKQPLAVGDTKWTSLGLSSGGWAAPTEAHVYQMAAYAAAYRCREFCLIYPLHSGLAAGRQTMYRLDSGVGQAASLHVLWVDVSRDGLPLVAGDPSSHFGRLLAV